MSSSVGAPSKVSEINLLGFGNMSWFSNNSCQCSSLDMQYECILCWWKSKRCSWWSTEKFLYPKWWQCVIILTTMSSTVFTMARKCIFGNFWWTLFISNGMRPVRFQPDFTFAWLHHLSVALWRRVANCPFLAYIKDFLFSYCMLQHMLQQIYNNNDNIIII